MNNNIIVELLMHYEQYKNEIFSKIVNNNYNFIIINEYEFLEKTNDYYSIIKELTEKKKKIYIINNENYGDDLLYYLYKNNIYKLNNMCQNIDLYSVYDINIEMFNFSTVKYLTRKYNFFFNVNNLIQNIIYTNKKSLVRYIFNNYDVGIDFLKILYYNRKIYFYSFYNMIKNITYKKECIKMLVSFLKKNDVFYIAERIVNGDELIYNYINNYKEKIYVNLKSEKYTKLLKEITYLFIINNKIEMLNVVYDSFTNENKNIEIIQYFFEGKTNIREIIKEKIKNKKNYTFISIINKLHNECFLCYEEYKNTDEIKKFNKCVHYVHLTCYEEMLKYNIKKCGYCKEEL